MRLTKLLRGKNSSKSKVIWDNLPLTAKTAIVEQLYEDEEDGGTSLDALRLVNHEWNELMNPIYWQVINMSGRTTIDMIINFVTDVLPTKAPYIKRLSLFSYSDNEFEVMDRALFYSQIIGAMNEVHSVEVDWVPTGYLPPPIRRLLHPPAAPGLRSLSLIGNPGQELDPSLVAGILQKYPLLRSVALRDVDEDQQEELQTALSTLVDLRWLHLQRVAGVLRPSSMAPLIRLVVEVGTPDYNSTAANLITLVSTSLDYLGFRANPTLDDQSFPFATTTIPPLPRLQTLALMVNFNYALLKRFDSISITTLKLARYDPSVSDPADQDFATLVNVLSTRRTSLKRLALFDKTLSGEGDTAIWLDVEIQCRRLGIRWEHEIWVWPDWGYD